MHADQVLRFEDSYFSTTVDDRERSARSALGGNVQTAGSLGADIPQLAAPNAVPLGGIIAGMRRRKDSDELEIISAAVAVNEAGYRALASAVRPGLLETEAFAIFQQAVTVAGADPVGELGNDFRGGCAGGRPRPVALVEGDLLPIDAGAVVRNYYSDMCRTFAVSGRRSAVQDQAFDFVSQALLKAESLVRPGIRCADVFDEIAAFLNSRRNSWRFDHHLGHGIGLEPVEPPFINKGSQDVFDEGDVFTLEPGLYGDDLRAGVRLEQDYVIEGGKLRRLSTLSLDI